MQARRGVKLGTLCLLLLVGACAEFASTTPATTRTDVESWASSKGFRADTITAGQFQLFSLLRQTGVSTALVVYIEGDGAGWPSVFSPPRDPTPRLSTALALANRDSSAAVAYLGRPCQYLPDNERVRCAASYWNERRFSVEVLSSMNAAISHLKQQSGALSLRLVGYSGGGVVAALLAMERGDVTELVTVAAPLALSDWVAIKNLSPLDGSIDPYKRQPSPLMSSATHFVGARDEVVPPSVVKRFVDTHGGRLLIMDDFDHDCCWAEAWPTLLPHGGTAGSLP